MNMKAAERRLSLQGLFEEIMLQQQGSPWLAKTDTLLPVPVEEKDLITRIVTLLRMRGKKPDLAHLFELVVRQMEVSMNK